MWSRGPPELPGAPSPVADRVYISSATGECFISLQYEVKGYWIGMECYRPSRSAVATRWVLIPICMFNSGDHGDPDICATRIGPDRGGGGGATHLRNEGQARGTVSEPDGGVVGRVRLVPGPSGR